MTLLSLDLQFVDSFRLAVAPFPVMNGAVQDMNWRSYIALRVSKKARIQRLYLGTVKRPARQGGKEPETSALSTGSSQNGSAPN
jgi:hypothetical protein